MADIDVSLGDFDMNNFEKSLQAWSDQCSSDMDLSNYFLDEKALEAITSTEIPATLSFHFESSPSSTGSSPLNSPFSHSQSPSSPSSDILSSPGLSSSSSSDEEADIRSSQPAFNFVPSDTINISSWTFDPSSVIFDSTSMMANEGSAFTTSCLPPLPVSIPLVSVSQPPVAISLTPTSPSSPCETSSSSTKASKKRRRTTAKADTKNMKADILSEEELLKFDSKGIESYIKSITSSRSVSPAEEKEMKRIRRLIKNREYAQSSRDKRKAYMEEMEAKLNVVHTEKAALQQRINALELENKTLKFHLARTLKSTAGSVASAFTQKSTAVPIATLFIVLFSFGLFSLTSFSSNTPPSFSSTPSTVFYRTGRQILEEIPNNHVESSFIQDLGELLSTYGLLKPSRSLNFGSPHCDAELHKECPRSSCTDEICNAN